MHSIFRSLSYYESHPGVNYILTYRQMFIDVNIMESKSSQHRVSFCTDTV